MKQYHQLETPVLYAVVMLQVLEDDGSLSDGALVDAATSIQIIIEDPNGTVVQALTDMSKVDAITGKYVYSGYVIPTNSPIGKFNYEVRAKDGVKTATARGSFEVIGEIA